MTQTFQMGDRVRKKSGSEWQGRIVGRYSTALTPEGYAVESESHAGSVQIYPAKALEKVTVDTYADGTAVNYFGSPDDVIAEKAKDNKWTSWEG